MIIVKITGGMGNQLFQYVFGLKWAQYHNTELKVDLSWYQQKKSADITDRPFVLDLFDLDIKEAKSSDFQQIGILLSQKKNSIAKVWNRLVSYFHPRYIKQDGFGDLYRKSIIPNNSFLDGYWIAKYPIAELWPALETQLKIKEEHLQKTDYLTKINTTTSVGVHIRRGDYVTGNHFQLSISYYTNAIKKIGELLSSDISLFIFSDDIEWSREKLEPLASTLNIDTTFIDHQVPSGIHNSYHFYLMTRCKHFIIANSTFSWWAARSGDYLKKVIICPNQFEKTNTQHPHLILDHWIPIASH